MKITVVCLVFSLPFIFCVFGGEDQFIDRHAMYTVTLQDRHRNHFCGGVVITFQIVLTAASCVKNRQPTDFQVLYGVADLDDSNGTRMDIDKIYSKEPSGKNNVHNNIAVLRLTKNMRDQKYIVPVGLSVDDENTAKEGRECSIYGWGRKSRSGFEITNVLQKAPTIISKLRSNGDVDESNLCTYKLNTGLCDFDTGGPLMSKRSKFGNNLWGIATDHHSCGDLTDDVFTRVDSHKDWILKMIEDSEGKGPKTHRPQILIVTVVVALLVALLSL